MKNARWLVMLAVVLMGGWFLSAGCSDGGETIQAQLKKEGETCAQTSECGTNLECKEGLCTSTVVPPGTPSPLAGPCSATQSCAADLICRGTICGPSGTALDTTFDGDGIVMTDFNEAHKSDDVCAILVQPDGKIVAVGNHHYQESRTEFALARFNQDGSLDNSFGTNGKQLTQLSDPSESDSAFAAALQGDGKIVVVGQKGRKFVLVRYMTNGALDTSFGTGGTVETGIQSGDPNEVATAVTMQPNGKIIAAGYSNLGGHYKSVVARYAQDGSLDSSFGMGGKVVSTVDLPPTIYASLAVYPNGKILAAVNVDRKLYLFKLNSDGSNDGVGWEIGGSEEYGVRSILMQSDDAFLWGITPIDHSGGKVAIAKYNTDGWLYTRLGDGGKLVVPGSTADDHFLAITQQPDGRLLVAGYRNEPTATSPRMVLRILRLWP